MNTNSGNLFTSVMYIAYHIYRKTKYTVFDNNFTSNIQEVDIIL